MATTENSNSKKAKITFWISTGLLALFILPGIFFMNSKLAMEGAQLLKVPEWLRIEVGIAHFIAALILIIPFFGKRIKEWAYVGLAIEYISATIAHCAIEGVNLPSFSPLILFTILVISYLSYHNMQKD
jgi:hypothetical protein